ncbi:MAG: hypothetical protein QXO51_06960 [Halobacteria archaeon]
MAGKSPRRRKIRKVIAYVCTGCYKTFPNGREASTHYKASHPAPARAPGKRGRRRGRRGRR